MPGRQMGQKAHVLIGELVEAGTTRADGAAIIEYVARHPLLTDRHVSHRQAARQRLSAAVACYFRFFFDEEWTLYGREVRVGRSRLDLVWETPRAEIVADEIKAGRLQGRAEREAVTGQAAKALKAGTKEWGTRFAGIRVLFLGAPRHSYLLRPDNEREPLAWPVAFQQEENDD